MRSFITSPVRKDLFISLKRLICQILRKTHCRNNGNLRFFWQGRIHILLGFVGVWIHEESHCFFFRKDTPWDFLGFKVPPTFWGKSQDFLGGKNRCFFFFDIFFHVNSQRRPRLLSRVLEGALRSERSHGLRGVPRWHFFCWGGDKSPERKWHVFLVDLAIKKGDVPVRYVSVPEGKLQIESNSGIFWLNQWQIEENLMFDAKTSHKTDVDKKTYETNDSTLWE